MTALALLRHLYQSSVVLRDDAGGLRCRAPKGILTPELLDVLLMNKTEILILLEAFEEPAALMECAGGLPRPEAERQAWACVLGEMPHD